MRVYIAFFIKYVEDEAIVCTFMLHFCRCLLRRKARKSRDNGVLNHGSFKCWIIRADLRHAYETYKVAV